jgi:hypothetical protein
MLQRREGGRPLVRQISDATDPAYLSRRPAKVVRDCERGGSFIQVAQG